MARRNDETTGPPRAARVAFASRTEPTPSTSAPAPVRRGRRRHLAQRAASCLILALGLSPFTVAGGGALAQDCRVSSSGPASHFDRCRAASSALNQLTHTGNIDWGQVLGDAYTGPRNETPHATQQVVRHPHAPALRCPAVVHLKAPVAVHHHPVAQLPKRRAHHAPASRAAGGSADFAAHVSDHRLTGRTHRPAGQSGRSPAKVRSSPDRSTPSSKAARGSGADVAPETSAPPTRLAAGPRPPDAPETTLNSAQPTVRKAENSAASAHRLPEGPDATVPQVLLMALLGLAVMYGGYRLAPAALGRLRVTYFTRLPSRTDSPILSRRRPTHEPVTPEPVEVLPLVERAVRAIQSGATVEGRTFTGVHAVQARPDRITLHTDPELEPTAPFMLSVGPDDRHRVMVCEQPDQLPEDTPGSAMTRNLATVGHTADNSIVLLNFEAAPHTAIIGPLADTRAALRALAVDLAISSWSANVVLAGFGAELPGRFADGRLTYVPALDQTTPAPAGERSLILSAEPLPHDRVTEDYAAVVFACPPEEAHRYPAAWHIELDGPTAHLNTLDLAFEFQTINDDEHATLLAALPLREPVGPDAAASEAALPQAEEGPIIRVLGTPELADTRGELKDTSKRARLTELAAYLFFHPGRDHHAMDQATWPDVRVFPSTRNSSVCRLRAWLGNDPQGHPYLPTGGNYTLSPAMRSDWTAFTELAQNGMADPTPTGTETLARSLALVHGQPFSGTDPRRYGWADCLKQQMIDIVAEVAHELATRHLAAGDSSGARAAALKGLLAEPGPELLLRDQILALAAAKNITAIKEIAERIARRTTGSASNRSSRPQRSSTATSAGVDRMGPRPSRPEDCWVRLRGRIAKIADSVPRKHSPGIRMWPV
jgi:hypothetical protein